MKDQSTFLDVIDRLNEHLAAIDHLTNTAPGSLGACLHMLEREMSASRDMLAALVEAAIEDEILETSRN